MINDTYIRKAKMIRVVDGDTIDVEIDLGFMRSSIERLHLNRINAPELRGEEKVRGLESKQFIESILPMDTELIVQSYKGNAFGKWLAEVYYTEEDGSQINLSDELVNKGYAVLCK